MFHTLAEIAVAVAGFSSLVIIFRGGSGDWNRQDYVSLAFALSWSIGSIFLSLLPIVLVEFEIALSDAARVGLFALAIYMAIVAITLTYTRKRIEAESKGSEIARASPGMTVLFCTIIALAVAAGFDLLPGTTRAWYAAIIVLLMAHATAELGLFVVQTIRRS